MWYPFHFDPLKRFVLGLFLQTLVGGVTKRCIAQGATISGAIKLIFVSPETYPQVPSNGVATAMFPQRNGSFSRFSPNCL